MTVTAGPCPYCRSRCTEEHDTKPGDFRWFLCRACGRLWDDKKHGGEGDGQVADGRPHRRDPQ